MVNCYDYFLYNILLKSNLAYVLGSMPRIYVHRCECKDSEMGKFSSMVIPTNLFIHETYSSKSMKLVSYPAPLTMVHGALAKWSTKTAAGQPPSQAPSPVATTSSVSKPSPSTLSLLSCTLNVLKLPSPAEEASPLPLTSS